MTRMIIDRTGDSDDKDQAYTYDQNGNRTSDESRHRGLQRPRSARPLAARPRPGRRARLLRLLPDERLGSEKDTGANQAPETDFTYLGDSDQLRYTETPAFEVDGQPVPASRSYYVYDDLGNVVQIQSKEGSGEPPSLPDPDPISADGACSTDDWQDGETIFYCYDEFERTVSAKSSDPDEGGPKSPEQNSYVYDGLDRRDLSISRTGQNVGEKLEHRYVGISELLSSEQTGPGSSDSYDYDSAGSRQGQATTSGSGTEYHGYGKDANGSITELEGQDGTVADDDTYVYDPYGGLEDPDPEDETTPEEELGDDAQDNPFRFQGFYYDSGVESYDMQAREYRPDVGRFLSQDRFAAAAGDLQLQSDPLTQDRYAFAGGNPVSMIEFDGHVSRKKRERRRFLRQQTRDLIDGIRNTASYDDWEPESKRKLRRLEQEPGNRGKILRIREETGEHEHEMNVQAASEAAARAEATEDPCWDVFCDAGRGLGTAASETADAIKDPIGTVENIGNAVTHPKETIDAIANSCDGKAVLECITYSAASLAGPKGFNSASRAARVVDDIPRKFVTTPRGTTFDVPGGWQARTADNGRGIVYQRPGAAGNADMIRIMDPTDTYPGGYFRWYNSRGQPLDIHGRPGPPSATHIPEDFLGKIPGWPSG